MRSNILAPLPRALARWRCFTCPASPPRMSPLPARHRPRSRSGGPKSTRFSAAMRRPATSSKLSLFEIEAVAGLLDGRRIHPDTTLLVTTSPEIKHAADRLGLTARIEAAGAILAAGICFYQSYARELAEANGWVRLMTNSAKLVNIIGGYGYRPTLASRERCIDAAVAGRVR